MQKYLDYHYDGPAFELLGTGHLLAVSIVVGTVTFLVWGRPDLDEAAKRRARLGCRRQSDGHGGILGRTMCHAYRCITSDQLRQATLRSRATVHSGVSRGTHACWRQLKILRWTLPMLPLAQASLSQRAANLLR